MSKNEYNFGKVIPAIVTVFLDNPKQSIDYLQMEKLANHLVKNGCDGILVNGTTGESPTTTDAEKAQLIKVIKNATQSKIPIMAGVGTNNTEHTICLAKQAEQAGANSLLVVSPYYNRPSQQGIVEHFTAVANATNLPVIVYDIPGRSGVQIEESTLETLAKNPKIVAVKDATGKADAVLRKIQNTNLQWYCGDDGLNLSMLSSGATGIISVVAHICGNEFFKVVNKIQQDNDVKTALAEFKKTINKIDLIMGGGQGASMVKAALKVQGIIENDSMRLPVTKATLEQIQALRSALI